MFSGFLVVVVSSLEFLLCGFIDQVTCSFTELF